MGDYTLGIKELDNAIGGIRNGSNIMMIGPPMSQKKRTKRYFHRQDSGLLIASQNRLEGLHLKLKTSNLPAVPRI